MPHEAPITHAPDLVVTAVGSKPRELYRWQVEALASWLRCGRRGVIEAVTGSGKTDVAIAAISDALDRGRFGRSKPIEAADDLAAGVTAELLRVDAGEPRCGFAVQQTLQWHRQR